MRCLRKFRVAVVAALAAIVAWMLIACGASVTVYDYTEDGIRYNMYVITIDADVLNELEKTAALDADGNKYTAAEYLYSLFTEYGYELVEATNTDRGYTVSYKKAVNGLSEFDRYCTAIEFTTVSSSDPFVRTITATSPSPFNGLREKYDRIPEDRSVTMLERIKNGLVAHNEYGDELTVFPSIDTAFPYLRGANYDGLMLKYGRIGSERMESSGTAVPIGNRNAVYEFLRYFDDSETQIILEYKRPVPYGWYLIALIAGAAVFAIVLYAAKRRAAKHRVTSNLNTDGDEFSTQSTEKSVPQTLSDTQQGDKDNAKKE